MPRLQLSVTSEIYRNYSAKIEKSLQGKAVGEFKVFNQDWLACGGCLSNYYAQLNFYKNTKGKEVLPIDTNGGIFK